MPATETPAPTRKLNGLQIERLIRAEIELYAPGTELVLRSGREGTIATLQIQARRGDREAKAVLRAATPEAVSDLTTALLKGLE